MWVDGRPRAAGPATAALVATLVALVVANLAGDRVLSGSAAAAPARTPTTSTRTPPKAGVAFVDGAWSLSYLADVEFSGPLPGGASGTGGGAVTGTGVLQVKGGGISGTHTGAGTAASAITVAGGESGPATLNLALDGPVTGTASRAVMQGDVRASGSVSVVTAGLSTAVEVQFGGALGDGAGAPMSMFSVGCDRITGTWAVDLRGAGAAASGLSVAGPATFVAIHTGDSSGATPPYATEVSELLSDADGFVGRVGNGPIDTAALDAIVARAETLSASIPLADACVGQRATAGYGTFVGVEIARVLNAVRVQLPRVATPDLVDLIGLGYRTAAIGSGATWSGAGPLERALRSELDQRLAAAVVAHDAATTTLLTVARRQFGAVRPVTAAQKPPRPVKGIAVIRPTGPVRGRGARPALTWAPVGGAAQYQLVLLDARRRPAWAWQGTDTSVVVGGAPKPGPAAASGPRVTKGCTWTVAALDAAGRPLALSASRPVAP